MKKLALICAAIAALSLISCKKETGPKLVDFSVSFTNGNELLVLEGIKLEVADANLTTYNYTSDKEGKISLTLPEGNYTWSANAQIEKSDTLIKYNGASIVPIEVKVGMESVSLELNKVVATSSIIIKELYHGGFYSAGESKAKTGTDAYVVLYNNSAATATADDIVFCFGAPYNAHATNKYYGTGSTLSYENENWIPAYGAIWWFTKPVTIPAYSSIVVAIWGAIDHTKTYPESVDLSKSEYYWMSNQGLTQYTNAKYTCSENIKSDHYLTCSPFSLGNAWALSTSCPAFYIGKLDKAEAERLSKDTENYDKTMGTSAANYVVKFPKANVVDAVEVYAEASKETSKARFPATINTGYISFTNGKGYTVYRNVDAEATRALAENEGLLVEGYADDPSGIDAEKSIANGAHIIFKDTNSSTNDFHERKVASLK